jgi:hypothetical protein
MDRRTHGGYGTVDFQSGGLLRAGEVSALSAARTNGNNGTTTVYHFNEQHYLESEHRDPTGSQPVVITYGRNAFSNFSTGVTVRCYDAHGQILRQAEREYEGDEATDAMVAKTCSLSHREAARP